ncbi:hypothetical protein ACSRUE_44415 [Sorangium sp. KYC3313]|uniref:hypothetical protein n=1 Tax=Sorangium sp. KYC3313 TaxID=3449740 RepID=UPI003F8CA37F
MQTKSTEVSANTKRDQVIQASQRPLLTRPRAGWLGGGSRDAMEVARFVGDTATPQARGRSQSCSSAAPVSYPGRGWPAPLERRSPPASTRCRSLAARQRLARFLCVDLDLVEETTARLQLARGRLDDLDHDAARCGEPLPPQPGSAPRVPGTARLWRDL